MSSATNIRPPESFNFQEPGKWTSWFKRFERFRIASGLMKESEEVSSENKKWSNGKATATVKFVTSVGEMCCDDNLKICLFIYVLMFILN